MTLKPEDELVHDYPKPLDAAWKENWYFNFIDRERNAWGISHISLMRHKQQGRFSAFHVVDGEVLLYSNVIEIEDELSELTDGKLKVEFLEPFKRFRLTFHGPRHQVELEYAARFDVYDYNAGRAPRPGRDKAMALNHYEQSLYCKGRLAKDGRTREIDCLGHRDHSWGYRNEKKVSGWNWIAVQFPEMTINMSRVVIGQAFMGNGFISTAQGNTRIVRVSVSETELENKVPVSSLFTGVDEGGKTWKLRSRKFSGLYLPMSEKGKGVVVHENFAEFENLETGEKGIGIDEYLVNPEM